MQLNPALVQATQSIRIVPGKVKESSLATWLVRGTHMFTLIKSQDKTLIFCHGNSTLFYARPDFMLHRDMPDGHAYLAQLAEDKESAGIVPRLLIIDLVMPRVENAQARNQTLRNFSGLFPPSCHLQWAGQVKALREFLKNGLPHKVEGIVALGNPLQLIKEIRIEAPLPVFKAIEELKTEQQPPSKRARV
jgi:hypothetical protein